MSFIALASTLGRLAIVPCYFLFVKSPNDILVAVILQATSLSLVGALSIYLILRHKLVDYSKPSLGPSLDHIRRGWLLFIGSAAPTIYTTSNSLVLGFIGGTVPVGLYTPADRIKAAAQGILQPVSKAAYPRSSRLMADSLDKGFEFARKILLLEGALGLFSATSLFFLADPIIHLLAGDSYEGSVDVLRMFALAPLLVGISDVLGMQVLLPARQEKVFGKIRVRAAIINLIVIVPLVVMLGPVGAAAGTILAEVYILAAMALACSKIGFFARTKCEA